MGLSPMANDDAPSIASSNDGRWLLTSADGLLTSTDADWHADANRWLMAC